MREDAERILNNILFDMWHIDMQSSTELRTEKLFGSKINMAARDLGVRMNKEERRKSYEKSTEKEGEPWTEKSAVILL